MCNNRPRFSQTYAKNTATHPLHFEVNPMYHAVFACRFVRIYHRLFLSRQTPSLASCHGIQNNERRCCCYLPATLLLLLLLSCDLLSHLLPLFRVPTIGMCR